MHQWLLRNVWLPRDYMPTSKNNGFVNPKTESKSKILIDCYNKKSNIPSTIMLLMEDIWKLTHDLNIHNCHHIYRKTNRIAYCLVKKKNLQYRVYFPRVVTKFEFEDYYDLSFNRIHRYYNL